MWFILNYVLDIRAFIQLGNRHDCDSNSKMQKLQVDLDDTNSDFDNNTKESEIKHLGKPAEDDRFC